MTPPQESEAAVRPHAMTAQAGAVAAPLRPDEVEVLMWPEKRGGMKVGMESGVIVHHRESGLAVGCRSERSQHKNRDIALAHLNAMLSPPAAVPVEALEGLVAKWREDADDMHASAMRAQKRGDMEAMYCNLDAAKDARGYADELTQLIKERSNG